MELAERQTRLWAALVDRLIILPVILVSAVVLPYATRGGGSVLGVACAVLLFCGIGGYQLWLLHSAGQTIGKRMMGIKIVLTKDLSNGGFVVNVLMRGLIPWVITMIPGLGILFAIADPSFIFRDDRLCLHDRIAGTCVIKA